VEIEDRLEFARAAVAVLRTLKITDSTMRYGDFAHAIGLISDGGRWVSWLRRPNYDGGENQNSKEREGERTCSAINRALKGHLPNSVTVALREK